VVGLERKKYKSSRRSDKTAPNAPKILGRLPMGWSTRVVRAPGAGQAFFVSGLTLKRGLEEDDDQTFWFS
jgi:hypothetical protein